MGRGTSGEQCVTEFSLKLAQLIAIETLLDHCGMQQLQNQR